MRWLLKIIGEIVRQVALIAILAGLLEMMLPQRSMSRYVRLVLGLFILVAILSPLAESFSRGEVLDVIAWDLRPQSVEVGSASPAQTWATASEEAALEIFRKRVASQMRALISLIPGVKTAEVEVEVEQDKSQIGKILGVVVTVKLAEEEPRPPEILIPQKPAGAGEDQEIAARIKQTLAFFYGLDPGVIVVKGR